MRSHFIAIGILWFLVHIFTAFRITNELHMDNLTEILGDTSSLELMNGENQRSRIIDEIFDGFNGSAGIRINDTHGSNESLDSSAQQQQQQQQRALIASSRDPMRGIIFRHKVKPEARSFFGLIIIPYIVCFFAAKGFWPFYPPMLQYQVNEMGKKIFALNDDRVRQFCRGKFNFQETCYRPVWYKGYFVPIDGAASTTDCPTECPTECPPKATTPTPTSKPPPVATSAQTWGDAPAKFALKSKPSKIDHHQNADVETFDGGVKTTTAKPNLDGEKQQQSSVNIEIHNVFSFGTGNTTSLPPDQPLLQYSPLNGQTDNKINLPNKNPQIIYA